MKPLFAIVPFVGALLLAGCASQPPASELVDLVQVASKQSFVLSTPVIVDTEKAGKISYMGRHLSMTLLPGKYTAVKKNSLGTFYAGESLSMLELVEAGSKKIRRFGHRGGIWIPSDTAAVPRLFTYIIGMQLYPDDVVIPNGSTSVTDMTSMTVADILDQQRVVNGTNPMAAGLAGGVAVGTIAVISNSLSDYMEMRDKVPDHAAAMLRDMTNTRASSPSEVPPQASLLR
jgi:hypothetical protein